MADQDFDRGKIHKLGSLKATDLQSGLKLDQYEVSEILWKDGNNIQFTPTGVQKIQGWSEIFTTTETAPIRGMVSLTDSGVQKLYYGDQTKLYESSAGSAPTTEGSGYTGNLNATATTPASTWSMVHYGTWVLATNGVDAPQIFKGAGFSAVNLDSMFTTAEIFVVRGPHVVAFNLSTEPRDFRWCDEDDPETWLPDTDNAAGGLLIRELDGPIVAAVPLGDRIAVYGRDQMFIVTYIGTPFYFGYKPALSSIGAVSKTSVIPRGRMNYGIGRSGIWQTDGVNFRYIDDPDIKDWVQENVNWAQASKINGFHDEENTQVKWFVPTTTGEPDTFIAYDYERGVWSKGDAAFTACLSRETFSNPILADSGGDVFYGNFGDNADGAALSANIVSTGISLGEPDLIKEITAIRIGYDGEGLRFRIGWSETSSGTVTWGSYQEVAAGFEFMPQRIAGRYIYLDIDSQDEDDYWELQAIDFHGKIGGTR